MRSYVLAAAVVFCATELPAAVVLTTSVAAPAISTNAQYNLDQANVGGGSWPYNVSIPSEPGVKPAQSFTVPGTSPLTLESFSLKGSGVSNSNIATNTWTVSIASVASISIDRVSLTPIHTVSGISGSAVATSSTDWLTWSFTGADVVTLAPGTVYAVQVWSQDYFCFEASANNTKYTGGEALALPQSGWGWAAGEIWRPGYDRTFIATVVPEPGSLALALGGLGMILSRRRRA